MSLQSAAPLLALPLLLSGVARAQDPSHATEFRMQHPGKGPGGEVQPTFIVHRLGTDHAEGISLLDMNGDGFVDILSGAFWYENPGAAAGAMWKPEKITDTYDTEGGAFGDINGDGKPDLALAHYNHSGVLWIDFSGPKPRTHLLGGSKEDGHGIGIADINGDGKPDVLTPHGWFEQVDANNDKWIWHGDWSLGDTGFPILGYDVNHDGKLDLIYGQGHGYGLYWLEQAGTPQQPRWIRHTIDESFSQSHALALVDIDGDGVPELITGKRYRGHSGNDPGSYDPVVVYAYRLPTEAAFAALNRGGSTGGTGTMVIGDSSTDPVFTRMDLSVNGTASAGTQFVAADLDHDGDMDLASAGKLGVHVLENMKVNNASKAAREETQPINRKWPFPGEGGEVPQEDGPTPKQ